MLNIRSHGSELVFFDQPEDEYCCPITHQIMIDPVVTVHGQTYEREAIIRWFLINPIDPMTLESLPNMIDPITGIELLGRPDMTLRPNDDLRRTISDFLLQHPELNAHVYNRAQLSERIQELEDSYYHYKFRSCSLL